MLRFVFRLASLGALCLGVIMATLDSIASVSASQYVVTSFRLAWMNAGPASLVSFRALVEERLGAFAWQVIDRWFLPQPAFAVCLAVALLLWMIGYKKPSLAGRFAA